MQCCIDIQAALAQRAGVGRYTQALVEHLAPLAGDDALRCFCFDFKRAGIPLRLSQAEIRCIRWCPGRLVQRAWKTIHFPPFDWLAGPADIYHFPNFIIPPLGRGRAVVTIHDVSFLRFPEAAEPKNLRYLNHHIRRTVDRADLILTDSDFSAREMQECLHVPPDRIKTVHLGLTGNMRAPDDATVQSVRTEWLLDRPYLIFVGTLEPRKNLPFLIEVFERLSAFDGDLIIAGMRGWKFEPILERMQRSPLAARIRYLDYVPESHLPALYAGATAFVFPSRYEGFGFPPLEAMRCGTPVCSSRAGSLPEVLGSAAHYIDHDDPADWAADLEALLQDTDRQASLRAAGYRQADRYTWDATARTTWEAYRQVAS